MLQVEIIRPTVHWRTALLTQREQIDREYITSLFLLMKNAIAATTYKDKKGNSDCWDALGQYISPTHLLTREPSNPYARSIYIANPHPNPRA